MCGINGIILKNNHPALVKEALDKMNNRIIHRGPDEDGCVIDQIDEVTIGFAMRRLSIIDLSSGKQPIFSDDGQKVIVFNGEIYNYLALKNELLAKGVTFKTTSDTEVILKQYEYFGAAAFQKLDGMFAFSILDKTIGKVFITRDFFGEKPLYYKLDEGQIIWGSELKSLLEILPQKPSICSKGMTQFFQLTYIPAPFTIYEGIKKLEANHYIEFSTKDFSTSIHPISEQTIHQKKSEHSFDEAKKKVKKLVEASVESRSVSDVPIGTFLSGGVDSSIVTLCLAKNTNEKINTFSIGFENKAYNETDRSQVVAKLVGSQHHEFIIGEKDFEQNFSQIIHNFDEPFADSSALPSFIVAQKTSQHVKVALTGDGGDEVFGGYNKYRMGNINQKYTQWIPNALHNSALKLSSTLLSQKEDRRGWKFQVKKALKSIDYDGRFYYNIIQLGFLENELQKILLHPHFSKDVLGYYQQKYPTANSLSDFREIDRMISLEGDMLVKVDRTSMLTSLESRAPFLNKKLWDYTHTLPENFLLNKNNKKRILKEAFRQDFPDGFLEQSKKGFGVPVGDWLKASLKEELLSYSTKEKIESQGLFSYENVQTLINHHLTGVEDNTFQIWTYFCFQKWYFQQYKK